MAGQAETPLGDLNTHQSPELFCISVQLGRCWHEAGGWWGLKQGWTLPAERDRGREGVCK